MTVKREEVKQVSKQWVHENCKNITTRDMGLLKTLFNNRRRLLRRDQVEVLYPRFASTDRLNKRLKALYNLHIIDRIYPVMGAGKGSSKQHICLDKAGMILLELEKYNKPIITNSAGDKALFSGWEHKIRINDYECILTQLTQEYDIKILSYVVEEPVQFRGTKIIPDITCLLSYNGKGYLFFIEVDMGTEDLGVVKNKLDNYVEYYLSKAWIKEEWNSKFKEPKFPRIMFYTNESAKRVKSISSLNESGSVKFSYGSHSQFRTDVMELLGIQSNQKGVLINE